MFPPYLVRELRIKRGRCGTCDTPSDNRCSPKLSVTPRGLVSWLAGADVQALLVTTPAGAIVQSFTAPASPMQLYGLVSGIPYVLMTRNTANAITCTKDFQLERFACPTAVLDVRNGIWYIVYQGGEESVAFTVQIMTQSGQVVYAFIFDNASATVSTDLEVQQDQIYTLKVNDGCGGVFVADTRTCMKRTASIQTDGIHVVGQSDQAYGYVVVFDNKPVFSGTASVADALVAPMPLQTGWYLILINGGVCPGHIVQVGAG